MIYCRKCLMPDTKPYLIINDQGICAACQTHEIKMKKMGGIDWKSRKREFERIIEKARRRKSKNYDVLVPVSGGKDSISQIHRLLKYKLRILAVNVDYGIKTEIGISNLSLIPEMGANLITYKPSQPLHKKLIYIGLKDFGDPDLLSHTLIYSLPLHVALEFDVPLVLWGENSAFEYSGDMKLAKDNKISRAWFMKYAANSGRDARFISRKYNIPIGQLSLYDFPDELEKSEIDAIFTSYYFYWDSEENLRIAKMHGFNALDKPREGTYRNYVGIDEKINRIHQYLKVLKFGYGRATDHACEDIRNKRLSKEKAKELVRKHDLMKLSDYYINDFVKYLGITRKEFFDILESHRNPKIWERNKAGRWFIPGHLKE